MFARRRLPAEHRQPKTLFESLLCLVQVYVQKELQQLAKSKKENAVEGARTRICRLASVLTGCRQQQSTC